MRDGCARVGEKRQVVARRPVGRLVMIEEDGVAHDAMPVQYVEFREPLGPGSDRCGGRSLKFEGSGAHELSRATDTAVIASLWRPNCTSSGSRHSATCSPTPNLAARWSWMLSSGPAARSSRATSSWWRRRMVSKAEGALVQLDEVVPSPLAEQWRPRTARRDGRRGISANRGASCGSGATECRTETHHGSVLTPVSIVERGRRIRSPLSPTRRVRPSAARFQ